MFTLAPLDPTYPRELRSLSALWPAPPVLESSRALDLRTRRVAIVGARSAHAEFRELAHALARSCALHGVIVLSGGASGVDGCAHEGALDAEGRTWLIAPHGRDMPTYPPEHAPLHQRIIASEGTVVWPFPPDRPYDRQITFKARNEVLVALADAIVILQAGRRSGTLHTANRARARKKPIWVAAGSPALMAACDLEGSCELIERGATIFRSVDHFLANGLLPSRAREDPIERAVVEVLRQGELHRDDVAERTSISASELAMAIFTLELEGVVRQQDGFLCLC